MAASFAKLVEDLASVLMEKKLAIVTAESCTGGMIAAAITERPGASSWFERGYVTYSNDAKMELLGVQQELLDRAGAVSAEVAQAMAEGAEKNSKAQIAIAVTGIAGPDGGSVEKPVGLVFIAVFHEGRARTEKHHFTGDRAAVRAKTCDAAFRLLLGVLSSVP